MAACGALALAVAACTGAGGSAHGTPHGPGVFVLCGRLCLVPVSGESVKGEDAPLVAAVVAAGMGDVGVADAAEGAGD